MYTLLWCASITYIHLTNIFTTKNFNNTIGTIDLEKVTLTHKFMLSPTNGKNIKKYYDYLMLIFPTTTLRVGKGRQISKKRTNEFVNKNDCKLNICISFLENPSPIRVGSMKTDEPPDRLEDCTLEKMSITPEIQGRQISLI